MAFTKITAEDIANKGVVGLPDTPNLSTQAMEEKFDELALDVLMPKHNDLIDELEDKSAAENIGAVDALGEATTVQAMIDRAVQSGYTKAETDALLSNKVDREQGKGLTTNDFSDAYKYKLNNIEDNANNYVLPKATSNSLGGVMPDNETFTIDENGVGHAIGGGGGGTANYEALVNKPIINGITVMGDKTSEEYGLLRPYILITSDAGSTVTITKGTVTIQATQLTSTTWGAYPTSYGNWTVKSSLAGADDATEIVTVDAVKSYSVSVNHISATITVTYPSGATCVLSKGAIEYTASTSPQTFTVQSLGVWTVTTTLDGIVKTTTVTISADGQSQSVTVEYAEIEVSYGVDFEGETITCTDGTSTYTKTASGGKVSFHIPTTGSTWTISSEASGTPYSTSVSVTEFTKYTVILNVFSATVTVTFPYSKGATCTLSDGNTTLTATTSPMAFSVGNTGTWVATVTLDNIVKSDSVSITTDGQTEALTIDYGEIELIFDNEFRGLSVICNSGVTNIIKTAPISGNVMYFYPPSIGEWAISSTYSGNSYSTSATVTSLSVQASAILKLRPNGSTVTPTDDIQTWLACGGITDKTYTTLSEVLSDSTTLATLIADNNAVDYMVRSKSWASNKGLVPQMTSNTAPSGVASADSEYSSSYAAYKSFDGDTSTYWSPSNGTTTKWLQYMFANAVRLVKWSCIWDTFSLSDIKNSTSSITLQGSNDGFVSDINNIDTVNTADMTTNSLSRAVSVNTDYAYFRISFAKKANNNTTPSRVQFYAYDGNGITEDSTAMSYIGLNNYCANTLLADSDWLTAICNSTYFESVLNVKVPTMTSNTTPSGECSASSAYDANHMAWKAFDGNNETYWSSQNKAADDWIQYQFTNPVNVHNISLMRFVGNDTDFSTFSLYVGNSVDSLTKIGDFTSSATVDYTTEDFILSNSNSYTIYRLESQASSGRYSQIRELQFYGRIDV